MGDMKWGRDWHFRIINMILVQQIVPGLYMYTHVHVHVCNMYIHVDLHVKQGKVNGGKGRQTANFKENAKIA